MLDKLKLRPNSEVMETPTWYQVRGKRIGTGKVRQTSFPHIWAFRASIDKTEPWWLYS